MKQLLNRWWILGFPLSLALLVAALGGAWLDFDRTDFVERARHGMALSLCRFLPSLAAFYLTLRNLP